jgi:hypothetical protein
VQNPFAHQRKLSIFSQMRVGRQKSRAAVYLKCLNGSDGQPMGSVVPFLL